MKHLKAPFCILAALIVMVSGIALAAEDSNMEGHWVTVTAKLLNGRMRPSKGAMKTAFFDQGDELELTGWWSDDRNWVEVYGGDGGECWVARQYVNEISEPIMVINQEYRQVKIRKKPGDKARVVGYLRQGREIEITQVLLGWGKCRLGWIDLFYVQQEE